MTQPSPSVNETGRQALPADATRPESRRQQSQKYCVLGAGSSGLAVVKNFAAAAVEFDCYEREDDIGGNWHFGKPGSSIYQSTHLISSKRLTEYPDFPMPDEDAEYLHHSRVLAYLRAYARHFGLYERIQFNTAIERVEPDGDQWLVTLAGGQQRRYRGVVIANGHNWDPRLPNYPGKFAGQILHSSQYKSADVLRGRRVLVVGAGNSGCDIAVEAAQNAERTLHSLRRGYHFLPKFVGGKPADVVGERMLRWRLPLALRRTVARVLMRLLVGPPTRFGLPRPDHRLFETHPIINSQLPYYVGHGDITIKPDVAELAGDCVRFVDGSQERVDVIVYATGYQISFPFLDSRHLNWRDGRPQLYLNIFHPQHETLLFCGLIQPDSGQFGLVDYQAQLMARVITARERGTAAARRFNGEIAAASQDLGAGIRYLHSPRHALEVEHFSYRRRLQKSIAKLGRS
ncbi:MAG TPA: NAD(P)-binding domain-containing protein [Pirellulales bacterium]|nr:NAD(P)-binding domain-containing protein [Pirellulales bacterium]